MIGRKQEIAELNRIYNRNKAELVAVYGRRRVGKTYLVDQVFKGKISFRHAGLSPIEMKELSGRSPMQKQLKHFYTSLIGQGMKKRECPKDWFEAFLMLEQLLEKKDKGQRMVVFFDELPWLDTQKSGFLTAFEGFWNTWACHRDNLMVVVCGSATTWIVDKLINNHGGLYDRVTYEIKLSPFTLAECEEFLKHEKVKMSRYDITSAYMIVGGIPYYLGYFEPGKSLAQSVDRMFFDKDAKLKFEYDRLFTSIFDNADMMRNIVEILSKKNCGYTRSEIAEASGYVTGGTLTDALKGLIASDFIEEYVPFGRSKREKHYKLIDPFCIFYNRFVKKHNRLNESFWMMNNTSQSVVAWRGLAFENVCFNHIPQIKTALGISGISSEQSAWSKRADDEEGTQIDMIIKRKDNIVNMCEMKFYSTEFKVDKKYHGVLINRQELLEREIPSKSVIHNVLITTKGLKYNEYSGFFDNVITLDELFT